MRTLRELQPSSYDTHELYGDYLEHASERKSFFAKGGRCLNRPVAPVGAACGLPPRGSSLRNEDYSDC
jgi:hypothetical protein